MDYHSLIDKIARYWKTLIDQHKLETVDDVTNFCLGSYDVSAFESTNNKFVTSFVLELPGHEVGCGIIEYDPSMLEGMDNKYVVKGIVAYPYTGPRKNVERWSRLWLEMSRSLHYLREMPCRSENTTNAWKRIMAAQAAANMRVVNAHLYVQPNGSIKKL
jgi:hypothetical protein